MVRTAQAMPSEVPVLRSTVDPGGAAAARNRAAHTELVADLKARLATAARG